MKPAVELEHGIYLIDTCYKGIPEYTGVYVVKGEKMALVESGATPGISRILAGLDYLGIRKEEIKYVAITHVHLDHGGGAGALAGELPEAKIVAHPRGAKHLIDPARLVAAVRELTGKNFEALYGEILPVPAERIFIPEDEFTLDLGGRRLVFYHTPGHARHHLCIYDSLSKGIFSGDVLGIRFPFLSRLLGHDYPFPITAPTEFDPDVSLDTMERIAALELQYIYFTHFGPALEPYRLIKHGREMIEAFAGIGRRIHEAGGTIPDLEAALWDFIKADLRKHGLDDKILSSANLDVYDLKLSARGLAHFFHARKREG
ncbi:MAG: MBL fold metallo-hydrolase [Peptococcaceae bacterium]|nr:MAG: MBL fold metallo-hydrolase [Peptococcaceae bacterium]